MKLINSANEERRCHYDYLCMENQKCRQWGEGEYCVCSTDAEDCERDGVDFFECETDSQGFPIVSIKSHSKIIRSLELE